MKTVRVLAVVTICLGVAFAIKKGTAIKSHVIAAQPVANTLSLARIAAQNPTPTPTPVISPVVPVDVNNSSNPSQNDWYTLGWQTFVALDWPALAASSGGSLGQPNTSLSVGATSNSAFIPTVWATYRDVSTVMLDKAANPGDWNTPQAIPSSCTGTPPVATGFSPMIIDGSTFKGAPLKLDYVNQATDNPLVDQEGWYTIADIRVDQSEYAYIQQNNYYSGDAQIKAVKAGTFAAIPRTGQPSDFNPPINLPAYAQYGALEVKATWRVLDTTKDQNIIPRYYTQWGYFLQPDGSCSAPTLFGLIALHILRLTPTTPATWFWATFEQVDNTSAPSGTNAGATLTPANPTPPCPTTGYNPPAPTSHSGNVPWNNQNTPDNICQITPIPSAVQQVNASWQAALNQTVWQYYEMDDTINPCPSGASGCVPFHLSGSTTVNTGIMANTAVESYAQSTSCMDCHAFAAPQPYVKDGPPNGSLQIFTFVLENAFTSNLKQTLSRQRFVKLAKVAASHNLSNAKKTGKSGSGDKYQQKQQ